MEPFLNKWAAAGSNWTGPLEFLNTWKSPYANPDGQMEQITPQGKRDAVTVGRHLLRRYPDLVPTTKYVYADKKPRTQVTAHAFVAAFPQNVGVLQIKSDGEFHAVVPHKSCKEFSKAAGDAEMAAFARVYTAGTIRRLQRFTPFALTPALVIGMQQLCGYESAIAGARSPLCAVWTPTEILGYEYLLDLKYYYMVGPGNPLSPYLGFPWLNVTAALFATLPSPPAATTDKRPPVADDASQRFFVSFTHREVPPFLATALGLFNSSAPSQADAFPTDHINFSRAWRMAQLIPFLGHIGIERLACDASSGAEVGPSAVAQFVRVIANSAPRPIPACQQGPGASCALNNFHGIVQRGLEEYGDFDGACGN